MNDKQTLSARLDEQKHCDTSNESSEESTTFKIGSHIFNITGRTKKDLFAAIKRNNLKEFIAIFERDIDLKNNPDELRMFLIIAGVHDALSIAQELIIRGAPIDKSPVFSSSPLLVAAFTQNLAFASLLIDAGADVNEYNQDLHTALHMAAHNNDLKMVHLLLNAKNITIDACDSQGRTPLMLACRLEGEKIIDALIEKNANIFKKDINGRIAAEYAFPFYQELFIDLQNKQMSMKPIFNKNEATEKNKDGKTTDNFMSSSLLTKIFSIGMLSIASYYALDLCW
jgi:ankyrin repeat protein